jgi:hypothetical protein
MSSSVPAAVSEGEWLDGMLLAQPTSSTGHRVQWQVYIEKKVTLGHVPDGDIWTIDVVKILQTNTRTGTEQHMRRVVIVAEAFD